MNIVVQYPTGRKDYASVAEGCTVVGSDKDCDIVIADGSIEKLHLKLFSDGKALEVENISSCAAWLNEDPLMERAPLVFGDILRIGGITITLQEPFVFGADKTKSPDGVRKMRKSIGRDVRAGWLGYRRVMEKLSSFISVDEAKIAADCYKSGLRAFFFVFAVVFVGNLAASLLQFEQWYKTSAVLMLCVQFFANAAILLLVGRFRMSFAGRILWPVIMLSQLCSGVSPASACNDYWDDTVLLLGGIIGVVILVGWLVDYGAGFVFEETKKRRAMRFSALLLISVSLIGLNYTIERFDPQPVAWYWSILAELPCLIWLFIYKRVLSTNVDIPFDSLFVAEIASRRAWKRVLWQCLAIVLLVPLAIGVLSLLGENERHQWPADNQDVLWTDENTKSEAWFWENRGRFFKKSDLDANSIFQIPFELLERRASTNEWSQAVNKYEMGLLCGGANSLAYFNDAVTQKIGEWKRRKFLEGHPDIPDEGTSEFAKLNAVYQSSCCNFVLSDFATNVCALVHAITTIEGNHVAYTNLCELLSAYRVTSSNFVAFAQNLGTNSICVICDSKLRHPEYAKGDSYVYSAGLQIGILSYTRERIEELQAMSASRKLGLPLVFVLTALAVLVLYRRGSDSPVGLWLGLMLFMSAATMVERASGFVDGIPEYVKYSIWSEAFENPMASLAAGCLSMTMAGQKVAEWLGALALAVLFVLLCWPTVRTDGKRKRWAVFVGKVVSVLVLLVVVLWLVEGCWTSSYLVRRVILILILGFFGWILRLKRRQYTEIPHLGFLFFIGWLIAEIANAVYEVWQGYGAAPISEHDIVCLIYEWLRTDVTLSMFNLNVQIGGLLMSVLPVLALLCWGWVFIKQRFLNVLTLSGVMLILVVFALPLATRLIGESLASVRSDNVFVSKSGMRIISAVIFVIVVPGLARFFRKLCRRVFMRKVYRMEQDVAVAIEKVFDESMNTGESIYKVLSCMRISSFTFYERVSKDGFRSVVSRNWARRTPEMLSLSGELRQQLGNNHELVEFTSIPYRPELFFVSFELWRLHLGTGGALMLPICLGMSVRGLLFVGAENIADMPTDNMLMTRINSIGLSAVTPR